MIVCRDKKLEGRVWYVIGPFVAIATIAEMEVFIRRSVTVVFID